jgi:HrpA-like RNA helicase
MRSARPRGRRPNARRGAPRGSAWRSRDNPEARDHLDSERLNAEESKDEEEKAVPLDLGIHTPERQALPIYQQREQILANISKNQTFIIHGETGCGKSTQVPQYILEQFPNSKIIVTQPRRMSTISLAKRVAEERRTELGAEVGYQIQSDRRISDDTRISFMTTGFFIAKLTAEIEDISWTHIILDEVHERSIEMDFLLVLIKHILSTKKDLKLIMMSATVDSEVFANYFATSSIENIDKLAPPPDLEERNWASGRIHRADGPGVQGTASRYRTHVDDAAGQIGAGGRPFDVVTVYIDGIYQSLGVFPPFLRNSIPIDKLDELYKGSGDDQISEVDERLLKVAAFLVFWQHTVRLDEPPDQQYTILVFLPGLHEINVFQDVLQTITNDTYEDFDICVLHSAMPEELHSRVFDEVPEGKRRVILSTNIAESSITLPDVRFVIDLGFSREVSYNSLTRMQSLELRWASKATMNQRKGRAGRVACGKCFRLMPQQFFETMLYEYARPEIQRCPLDKLILRLKQIPHLGSPAEVLNRTIEPPDLDEISRTEKYLIDMGALDRNHNLTWLGERYSEMPCDIRITRLIIYGYIFGIAKEGLLLAAIMSQERPPIPSPSHIRSRMDGMSSKYYSSRIVYDGSSDSDPITMLNAYFEWKKHVGKFVCRHINRSFKGGRLVRPWLNPKEKDYCRDKHIDGFIMREIYQTYLEYRKRITQIEKLSDLLESNCRQSVKLNVIKTHDPGTGLTAMKLIIAAAYKGKYLVADYILSEDSKRSKLIQRLHPLSENKLLIPGIPEGVVPAYINEMLEDTRDPHISVNIDNGYAYVELSCTSQKCMRMALWLGQHSNRYRTGDFIVLQKVLRHPVTNEALRRIDIKDRSLLYKLPREIRLEAKIHVLEQEELVDGIECVEAACLSKPEYPYQLKFKDYLTKHDVKVADDSVNFISFEHNEALMDQCAWVCAEYVDRFEAPLARMVTALPKVPLSAHIFTMLFSRHIELCTDERQEQYDCFKTDTSAYISLEYRLSNADIEKINIIRKFISNAVSSTEQFIKAPDEGIAKIPAILEVLYTDRLKVLRDAQHWRDIIIDRNAPRATRPVVNEDMDDNDYLKCIQQIELIENPDNSVSFAEKVNEMRQKKVDFLQKIEQRVKFVELRKTELQCKLCNFTLGQYDKLEVNDMDKGYFYLNSTFGMIHFKEELDENSDFVKHFAETLGGLPEQWCTCSNDHVIGWSESGRCLIAPFSPIILAFPTVVYKEWTRDLWEDNLRKLTSHSRALEAERNRTPVELICELCDVEMKTEREFIKHFYLTDSHKENMTKFAADFT